jgi:hypothetical protein
MTLPDIVLEFIEEVTYKLRLNGFNVETYLDENHLSVMAWKDNKGCKLSLLRHTVENYNPNVLDKFVNDILEGYSLFVEKGE